MNPSNIPAKLHEGALAQFEQVMHILNLPYRIGLSLSPFVQKEHLAASLILEKLNTFIGLKCSWQKVSSKSLYSNPSKQWVLISGEGDAYLVSRSKNGLFRLSAYSQLNEVVEAFEGSLARIFHQTGYSDSKTALGS